MKAMKGACKHCGLQENQHGGGKCRGYEKDPLKPILGLEFYLSQQHASVKDPTNAKHSHLVVLAKNKQGWLNLVRASSESNKPDHVYRKPRLSLDQLAAFPGGQWVAFSGHMGSDLANVCFADLKGAYGARTYDEAKSFAKPWAELKKDVLGLAGKYQDVFGKGNFWLEIQLIDAVNLPAAEIVAKTLRWVSKQTGIPCVATGDAHYPSPEDAPDQRVLLCSAIDTTLKEVERKLAANEDVGLGAFFRSNRYHIPSDADMVPLHTDEELDSTIHIAEMCETYDITAQPRLPKFPCPDGLSADDHLRKLVDAGWRRKVDGKVAAADHPTYRERVERELGVLSKAGLADYFLIVEDYCSYARNVLKCKLGRGRGSGAGSLVLHLLNVTDCDPIKHDLLFERFYNDGRNSPGRISLPDVDCDFPITKREFVIDYVRRKYGDPNVCQMATYGRMQGREALTAVLRAHEWGTFDERKEITAHIPDEAAIADQLQEMREETGEASIITWALENESEALAPWCKLTDDGSLEGPLAPYFAQAIRLEGTKKSQGKHAAGVIISTEPLSDSCPMGYDKSSGRPIAVFEMGDLEAMGFPKFDFLGVAVLDKLSGCQHTSATGKVGMI